MDNDLIRRKIVVVLLRNHEAATNFSLVCKRTWRMLAQDIVNPPLRLLPPFKLMLILVVGFLGFYTRRL